MHSPILILGCGYTGRRVANLFIARGVPVFATSRDAGNLEDLARKGASAIALDALMPVGLRQLPEGLRVLHSIPPVDSVDLTPGLLKALGGQIARLVYLSTTGVYGAQRDVDHTTTTAGGTLRERLRVEAESAVLSLPAQALVLRPAAIYGPGRGIHVSMQRGEYKLAGEGANFVSRIHVEDLAAHAEAALLCELAGAFPVADEEPCTSREIAAWCAELLRLPMPSSAPAAELHETRQSDRRVDGRRIRQLLGISLRYPSYRTGIPASL